MNSWAIPAAGVEIFEEQQSEKLVARITAADLEFLSCPYLWAKIFEHSNRNLSSIAINRLSVESTGFFSKKRTNNSSKKKFSVSCWQMQTWPVLHCLFYSRSLFSLIAKLLADSLTFWLKDQSGFNKVIKGKEVIIIFLKSLPNQQHCADWHHDRQ